MAAVAARTVFDEDSVDEFFGQSVGLVELFVDSGVVVVFVKGIVFVWREGQFAVRERD